MGFELFELYAPDNKEVYSALADTPLKGLIVFVKKGYEESKLQSV
jgi:hypothetical protein